MDAHIWQSTNKPNEHRMKEIYKSCKSTEEKKFNESEQELTKRSQMNGVTLCLIKSEKCLWEWEYIYIYIYAYLYVYVGSRGTFWLVAVCQMKLTTSQLVNWNRVCVSFVRNDTLGCGHRTLLISRGRCKWAKHQVTTNSLSGSFQLFPTTFHI